MRPAAALPLCQQSYINCSMHWMRLMRNTCVTCLTAQFEGRAVVLHNLGHGLLAVWSSDP